MHFSSKLPIVFIQSCFTMASSGAAPLLPASGAGLPFEIPTPSHSPFQIESRSSSYWPLRQDDLLRMMPEPQRDQAWHVLPAKFKLEPSGDGGHYLACQYANGWEERRLWNYFNIFSMQMTCHDQMNPIITTKSHQICLCAFRCPLWMALIGQLKLDNYQCQMVQHLIKLSAPCEGNP